MMNIKTLLFALLFFMVSHAFAQDAKKYTTYVVKSGETLKSIAKKIGCKTKEIKDLNPDVDKKTPRVNTTLVVPNKNFGKLVIKDHSKPKAKVIVHIVAPKETFYGIAKKYNVTIQSIKDANPSIANGLIPGQKIRIPSKSEYTVQPEFGRVVFYKIKKGDTKWRIATVHNISIAELERINPELTGNLKENDNIWVPAPIELPISVKDTFRQKQDSIYIYHVVKQGEGLFRIAVLYDTTQDEIKRLNPEASKNLRLGMLLKIPGKKKAEFLIHKVLKGDTFFNLTRKYNIHKRDLLSLNPDLENGLKLGMQLKIKPFSKKTDTYLIDSFSTSKRIHLSFLMPLMANKEVDKNSKKDNQLRTICTDFFMGAEIAIDSLQKQGLDITYHVYDTKDNPSQLYHHLQNEDLKNSDAIIGPFFFGNAQKIANELPDIPIFAPLYSKKQTKDFTPNLIKTAVDKKKMITTLIDYLKTNYQQQKILIITDTSYVNKAIGKKIKNLLKTSDSISDISFIIPSHNKKKPEEIYMDKKKLQESINDKKDTWVILASDNTIVTSDIVNTYGVMANDTNIRLFTTKTFDSFEYLDYQYLSQLLWSFPANQFDQLSSISVESFNENFYHLNYTYPSSYAYTGFDLTYDSLIRLAISENFNESLTSGISNRLAHQFKYENTENGFINKGVLMIIFNKDMEFKVIE